MIILVMPLNIKCWGFGPGLKPELEPVPAPTKCVKNLRVEAHLSFGFLAKNFCSKQAGVEKVAGQQNQTQLTAKK